MCGFAGIYKLKDDYTIKKNDLLHFEKYIENRGKDQRGFVLNNNFGVVHHRLSVIDPQNGKQPMEYKNNWLLFNGEIYNYLNLKKKLKDIGINITSNSDTEVLLKYLVEFGIESISELDGMFSFALINNHQITLARDPVGMKPLFYKKIEEYCSFSSSLKSLKKDHEKLDYLPFINGILSGNLTLIGRTIYENINMVEAGQYVIISKNSQNVSKIKYWQISSGKKYYHLSLKELQKKAYNLIDNAVQKRLISDVNLGLYLSGGLDSSIITLHASKYQQLNSYSICYNNELHQENKYAQLAADYFKTNHKSFSPDINNYSEQFEETITQKGTPLSTPNEIPIYLLAKQARKDVKVVLSGEGSDELFGGYKVTARAAFDYIRFLSQSQLLNPKNFNKSLLSLYNKNEFTSSFTFFSNYIHRFSQNELLHIFKDKDRLLHILKIIEKHHLQEYSIKTNNNYNFYQVFAERVFQNNLVSLLERLDFNTMQANLEARAPFLDKALIDFAFNIPYKYKIHFKNQDIKHCFCDYNALNFAQNFDTSKYLLRQTYMDKIPSQIVTRKKESFPISESEYYHSKKLSQMHNLNFSQDSLIDTTGVKLLISNYQKNNLFFKMWCLENLLIFCKIFDY